MVRWITLGEESILVLLLSLLRGPRPPAVAHLIVLCLLHGDGVNDRRIEAQTRSTKTIPILQLLFLDSAQEKLSQRLILINLVSEYSKDELCL